MLKNYFSESECIWTIGLTCKRLFKLCREILNDVIVFPLPVDFEDQSDMRLAEFLKVNLFQRHFMFQISHTSCKVKLDLNAKVGGGGLALLFHFHYPHIYHRSYKHDSVAKIKHENLTIQYLGINKTWYKTWCIGIQGTICPFLLRLIEQVLIL